MCMYIYIYIICIYVCIHILELYYIRAYVNTNKYKRNTKLPKP